MKANFLFVGLNANTNVQEKTLEIRKFHGWWFKNKEHQKYLNVEIRLLFSAALVKFLAARLVPLLAFTKRSFDLVYVLTVSTGILYLSKLTKFGLIITIFCIIVSI